MKFIMHNYPQYALRTGYYDKYTEEFVDTKSFALQIDNPSTLE
jgi:hypothetical protein